MKQEDKQLVLEDLCARIPYGVMCIEFDTIILKLHSIEYVGNGDYYVNAIHDGYGNIYPLCAKVEEVKLFLRPMSTMTDEEKVEYEKLKNLLVCQVNTASKGAFHVSYMVDIDEDSHSVFTWLNAHHFDYRGLIERGLAVEARDDMYK